MTSSPPGKREQNKAEKWARILAAAGKLFRERGYMATTTSEIAKAAGIGTGTLFLYASTKEELLVAVFREEVGEEWERALASADTTAPLLDQLDAAFGSMLEYHEGDPELSRAFLHEMVYFEPEVRREARDFLLDYLDKLERFLLAARARRQLAAEVDCHALAENAYALYQFHNQRRPGRSDGLAGCRAALRSGLALLLAGVAG